MAEQHPHHHAMTEAEYNNELHHHQAALNHVAAHKEKRANVAATVGAAVGLLALGFLAFQFAAPAILGFLVAHGVGMTTVLHTALGHGGHMGISSWASTEALPWLAPVVTGITTTLGGILGAIGFGRTASHFSRKASDVQENLIIRDMNGISHTMMEQQKAQAQGHTSSPSYDNNPVSKKSFTEREQEREQQTAEYSRA